MATQQSNGKPKDYGISKETVDSIMKIADMSVGAPTGLLRSAAGVADIPISMATSFFRERDPNRSWPGNFFFGYQPIQGMLKDNGLDYEAKTTPGQIAQALGEFSLGAIGKAPAAVKGIGILSGALGSEAAGHLAAKYLGEGARPYAKLAGGLLSPIGATRIYNRFVGIPNTVIPKELPPGGEEALVALASKGNKLFKKPLMQWAEGGVGEFMSKTRGELEELSNLNRGSHAEKLKHLSDKKANNLDLVERLKDEIRQYEPNLKAKRDQKLPSTNFIEDEIKKVGERNLSGLDKLRRDIEYGKPGSREAYKIISNFIEENAPGYQNLVDRDNVARQAELMLNSLKSKSIRSKNEATALKNLANDLKDKLDVKRKLDFETLKREPTAESEKLSSLYDEIQNFAEAIPGKSPEAIQKAIAARALSNEGSIGYALGHPLKTTGKGIEYLLQPSLEQQNFMNLFPNKFGSPYGQGLKGAGTTFINSSLTDAPKPVNPEDIFIYEPQKPEMSDQNDGPKRGSIREAVLAARGNRSQTDGPKRGSIRDAINKSRQSNTRR